MGKFIGSRYLVGLVLFLNLPGFANSVSGTVTSSAKITVRAFKYAPISPETWEVAQNVATRILDRTGMTEEEFSRYFDPDVPFPDESVEPSPPPADPAHALGD